MRTLTAALLFAAAAFGGTNEGGEKGSALPRIQGRVLLGDRPAANVEVRTPAGRTLATTDRRGAFRISLQQPATVLLFHREDLGALAIPLPVGSRDVTLPDVRLHRAGALRVELRGVPPGTKITASQSSDDAAIPLSSARVDPNMIVTFRRLQPGRYVLSLEGEGALERHRSPALVETGKQKVAQIWITPVLFEAQVTHGGSVVPLARVQLRNTSWGWSGRIETDENGHFAEPVWQLGNFVAVVTGPALAPQCIVGRAIESVKDLPWRVELPAGRVHGAVVDTDGAPVEKANVYLRTTSSRAIVVTAIADRQGRFEFNCVSAGEQSLTADGPGLLRAVPLRFRLDEEDTREVSIPLRRGMERTLTVRTSDGAPAAGATVMPFVRDLAGSPMETDGEGHAQILADPADPTVVHVVGRDRSFVALPLDPSPSSGERPIAVRLPPTPATIVIRTETTSGIPLSRVKMLMRYEGRMIPRRVLALLFEHQGLSWTTDENGTLSLEGMPAGVYEFWPYRTEEEALAILNGIEETEAPVRVEASAGRNTVTIRFD